MTRKVLYVRGVRIRVDFYLEDELFAVSREIGAGASLDAFSCLAKTNSVFALGFTVLILAQAGVPLTSGFVAKFSVIRAAVSPESYVLAVLAMVSAVIAAYLYLRIMVSMWLAEPSSSSTRT